GRDDARGDEPGAAAHLAGVRQDGGVHHALHRRGGLPRRPRGRDVAAARPHRRRRRRRARPAARPRPRGLRRLRRLHAQDPPGAGAARRAGMTGAELRRRPHLVLIPLVFVAFVAGWEAVVRFWRVPDFLLPAPSAIARALGAGLANRVYLEHAWIT